MARVTPMFARVAGVASRHVRVRRAKAGTQRLAARLPAEMASVLVPAAPRKARCAPAVPRSGAHAPGRGILAIVVASLAAMVLSGCHAPPEPDNLGQWFFLGMGAGEESWKGFTVGRDYERMSLNYNFTNVSHVRLWFTDPGGGRWNATLDGSGLPELNVSEPAQGDWRFHLATLNETGRQGSVEVAVVWVLGVAEGAKVPTEQPTRQR